MINELISAANMLKQNLLDYTAQIERAYLMAEDKFKISLSVTMSPEGSGTKIKTEITFIPEKVKDKSEAIITKSGELKQQQLDFSGGNCPKSKITHSYAHKVQGHSAGARARQRGYTYH